jgi:hypothetical protein
MTGDISVLCIGDNHGGSATGLTPPPHWYRLRADDDLDTLARMRRQFFAKTQRILWRGFDQNIKELGPVDVCVVNADMVDGSHFQTIEHITTDVEVQADIAKESYSRVRFRGRPDWRFTYGTPVHTVTGMNVEHLIAEAFGGEIKDTIKLRLNGLNIQWRHHQGRSDIPTGQGAQLSKELIRDILRSSIYDYPQADVVLRSHVHYWYHLGFAGKEAFSIPCLQVPISIYGRQLRTMFYDMGILKLTVDRHGNLDYQKRLIPLNLVMDEDYEEWRRAENRKSA